MKKNTFVTDTSAVNFQDIFDPKSKYFNHTGKPLYMDGNYYTQLHYKFVNERAASRKKGKKCMYPNCNKKPIKSHTIPEAKALKVISENDHILYPLFNDSTAEYKMKKDGTGQTSIFPGFCEEHEDLFKGFECTGNFQDDSIVLQNFRVICRDLYFFKSIRRLLQENLNRYRNELNKYHNDLVGRSNIKKSFKLQMINDENTEHMEKSIEFLNKEITDIVTDFYNPFTAQGDFSITSVSAIILGELPVCFAGRSSFEVKNIETGEIEGIQVALTVLPYNGQTFLTFTTKIEYQESFMAIISNYNSNIEMLSFIESWMIYGSDYWYIKPSYWENFVEAKKERILEDLKINNVYPVKKLEYSIFDDIRELIIGNERSNDYLDKDDELILEVEGDKLKYFNNLG
ncbi:hypothetical protein [Paenibacillus alvei]|uniref:hypothetical protein n=1 Tax=Paenibacillus alvei TaxID=44250 RepID=UPI0013D99CDA|nr:hypothetical protein [Paenibacillus alvei]NEZ42641.1 hypothetical protein [Paenibacillus alvei]